MNKDIEKLIEEKAINAGLGDYEHFDNSHIAELMKQHAASEIRRFAQHLKDQGFSIDLAYANHVQDCFISFDTKE